MFVLAFLLFFLNNIWFSFGTFCDDAYECEDQTITDAAYCRGYRSCDGATIDSTSNVQCSGDGGCYYAEEITAVGSIDCSGDKGCYQSGAITSGSNFYSAGDWSATYAESITAASDIHCAGDHSCYKIDTTISAEGTIECDGDTSCAYSTLNSDESITCDGFFSCYKSTIESGENIECDGDTACSWASLTAPDIEMNGNNAGYQSTIIANGTVVARGYFGLFSATLQSLDGMETTVESYGYLSGYSAELICESGSICNLNCKYNGCYNMDLICYSGAVCNVDCDDDDTDCPEETISAVVEDDIKLDQYRQKRKLQRKNDEFYNQFREKMEKFEKDEQQNEYEKILSVVEAKKVDTALASVNKYSSVIPIVIFIISVISILFALIFGYSRSKCGDDNNEYKVLLPK